MAKQTVLILLAVGFCVQSDGATEFLWGRDAAYNALCPAEQRYTTVAFPEEECRMGSYIMCSNGQAIAINDCPRPRLFNSTVGWCDQPENVPTPAGCVPQETNTDRPPTCDDGFAYLPVEGSCKKYKWCLPNGSEIEMACPYLSYYVHDKQRCLFITEPYVNEIPDQYLNDCLASEPYTPAPTSSTAAPAVPGA